MKGQNRGRDADRMRRNKWSKPDAAPLAMRAHWLLCAVCRRGGCKSPPPGCADIDRLLEAMWAYPFVLLKIGADLELPRTHFLDAHARRKGRPLPADFEDRRDDYIYRKKDLDVCRLLGIFPNTVLPAYHAYQLLFKRAPTLAGVCRTGTAPDSSWPDCPHARKGYYEKIAARKQVTDLKAQTKLGERMDGQGLWAMLRPRTREDMTEAKKRSARFILEQADRLFIRPTHALCILCTHKLKKPLIQDNLIELRLRMEREPDIPVTLTEGCCMVCDSCNLYHPDEHVCYHADPKNYLRDLTLLQKLGLKPGATLPAHELYRLIYERISSLMESCGWQDGSNTTVFWSPCGGCRDAALEECRRAGVLVGETVKYKGKRQTRS